MRSRGFLATLCAVLALPAAATAAPKPDLQVRAVSSPSSQEAPGSRMLASATVRNRGARTARPTRLGFYLSRDRRKGRGDFRLLPRPRLGARRPRTRARLLRTLRVPAGVPAGNYALVACADDTRRVRESRERNNCRSATRRIRIVRPGVFPPAVPPARPPSTISALPTLRLGGPPNGSVTSNTRPTYSGTAQAFGSVISRIEAKVDTGAFSTAGVACSACGTPGAGWTFAPPAPLADGPHTFVFRAIDSFGRSSPTITRTLTIDTTPPAFTAISATAGSTTVTATFSEALDCLTANPFDFTAEVNNVGRAVTQATCTGSTVTLTLGSAPTAGAIVEVTLIGVISDPAGNVVPRPTSRTDPA